MTTQLPKIFAGCVVTLQCFIDIFDFAHEYAYWTASIGVLLFFGSIFYNRQLTYELRQYCRLGGLAAAVTSGLVIGANAALPVNAEHSFGHYAVNDPAKLLRLVSTQLDNIAEQVDTVAAETAKISDAVNILVDESQSEKYPLYETKWESSYLVSDDVARLLIAPRKIPSAIPIQVLFVTGLNTVELSRASFKFNSTGVALNVKGAVPDYTCVTHFYESGETYSTSTKSNLYDHLDALTFAELFAIRSGNLTTSPDVITALQNYSDDETFFRGVC